MKQQRRQSTVGHTVTPRQYSLVQPVPSDGLQDGLSPFRHGQTLIFFGEIPNMPGHCIVADHKTGKLYSGYHTDRFVEIPDDET